MEYWHPMPQALAHDLLAHRWTPENPAPDAVGFMVALDRMRSGHPWPIRRLAAWAGWTRHRARRVRDESRAYLDEWEARTSAAHSYGPPPPKDSKDLQDRSGQIPDKKRTIPDIAGAVLQSQVQNSTNQPDDGGSSSLRSRAREQARRQQVIDEGLITAEDAAKFIRHLHGRRQIG